MDEAELALRRRIVESFARGGAPPDVRDEPALEGLAQRHVVALDEDGGVLMAHPFAAHRRGARVDAGGRRWWGNCAWDAFGIVAALALRDAVVTDANAIAVRLRDGEPAGAALFHVAVPARDWWADIAFT